MTKIHLGRPGRARVTHRRGFLAPAVAFGMVMMAVLSVAALRMSTDELSSVRGFKESTAAFYAAEAGLRKTLGSWPGSTSPAVDALSTGDSVVVSVSGSQWVSLGAQAGFYRTVIHRIDNGGVKVFLVVVQGRGQSKLTGQRVIESVVTYATGSTSIWVNAIWAGGDVVYGGSGSFADSYNSNNGVYGGNVDSNLVMRLNGNITLNNDTKIYGSITTHGTNPSVGSATITGGLTTGAATQTMPPVDSCPTTGFTPATGELSPSVDSHIMTYSSGDLIVKSGETFALSGTSYFFNSIKAAGTLYFTSTSHVEVWIKDSFETGSSGSINTDMSPTRVTFRACGAPAKPGVFTVGGGSNAYFAMYAPNRDVKVQGGGDFFGAVIGSNVTINGGSKMHYDKALALGSGLTYALISGGWVELTLY
jgi:hypothetical protein